MTGLPEKFSTDHPLAIAALNRVCGICKGNGVRADSIAVVSHTIGDRTLNAGTYLELKPTANETILPGKTVTGQLVSSKAEAERQIDQALTGAAANPAFKAQIANVLLQRPDHGFGLSHQAIPIDFMKREFTWHESCQGCRGSGQGACATCGGRKVETCLKCTGRGMMMCPMCRGAGLLQGNKCGRCHGQRYVPCDSCNRSGMMMCRVCRGSGISKCATCGGQGSKSHLKTLLPQAMTYFEYDRKAIPAAAADLIETSASALVTEGRIAVKGRIADDKENALGASYEVSFPYGDITFMVGKKEVKAGVFGKKADIVGFPFILDKMLHAAVDELERAAQGAGDVAGTIRAATKYRLVAQAFLWSGRTTQQKTVAMLMKAYDIGLSRGMAEKIATLADETTARITRKPRYYGLAAGLAVYAGVAAAYYLLGLRAMIAAYLPDQRFDVLLDLASLILGGLMTTACIQMFGAGAIKKALGHLMKKGGNAPPPKTRSSGLWGYAGVFLITLAVIEFSGVYPYWYGLIRNLILTITGGQ